MRDTRITIIGAGIGGLVAARALQQFGFRPRVYERSPALEEVGAGLTLAPNASHALNAIGLGPMLDQCGMQPGRSGVKHWQTGEVKVALARGESLLEKHGARYYHIHRADLHHALAQAVLAADPDAIQLGAEFEAVRAAGSEVEIDLRGGPSFLTDVAIGADGLGSNVRAALFGADQPRFTGYIAFRGLVPADKLSAQMIDPPSCLSTGPDRSFARYLIRDGETLNFVALAQRDGWRDEGWSIPASVEEVLAEYVGWHEDVLTIIRNAPADGLFKWALFDRDPLPEWTRGRVTLMGDAAHPMLPFLGQGAAMAIEDGLILGRAFAAADSIDEALQRYVDARQSRTTWVMLKSRETALAYHSGHDEHYQPGRHITAQNLGIWDYNPATVAV